MENEKLKKSIEILQRTVQSKNNEIDNKNNLLNKLLEGFNFNPLCPDPRDTILSEHVEVLKDIRKAFAISKGNSQGT